AAERNCPGARVHLGLCYYRGHGVNKHSEGAAKWLTEEAAHEGVGAEPFLGLGVWTGSGVSKARGQAEKWWREAAIQGIVPWRYASGDDTGGDALELEQWWRQVASQGNAGLQSCVGEFYHFGHGVTQDDVEAIKWYRQAAAQGDLVALKRSAWLHATCPNPSVRNGTNAVEFAQKAAAVTRQKDASVLDTLAAAYAEIGQFDKAVRTEKQAISLSTREDELKEYEARLRLYQEKKPYRSELN